VLLRLRQTVPGWLRYQRYGRTLTGRLCTPVHVPCLRICVSWPTFSTCAN